MLTSSLEVEPGRKNLFAALFLAAVTFLCPLDTFYG